MNSLSFGFSLLCIFAVSKYSIQCEPQYQRFGKERPTPAVTLKTEETLRLSVRDADDTHGMNKRIIEANIKEIDNKRTTLLLSIGGGNMLQIEQLLSPESRIFYGSIAGEVDSLVSVLQIPGKNHKVTFVSQKYKLNTNHRSFIQNRLRLSINYLHLVDHRIMQTEKEDNDNEFQPRNFRNIDRVYIGRAFDTADQEWENFRYILEESDFSDICNPQFRYPYSSGLRCCSEKVPLNGTQCSGRSMRCTFPPCKTGKNLCCPRDFQFDYYYDDNLYCCKLADISKQDFLIEENSCQVI